VDFALRLPAAAQLAAQLGVAQCGQIQAGQLPAAGSQEQLDLCVSDSTLTIIEH
jgi:hypothetical protein